MPNTQRQSESDKPAGSLSDARLREALATGARSPSFSGLADQMRQDCPAGRWTVEYTGARHPGKWVRSITGRARNGWDSEQEAEAYAKGMNDGQGTLRYRAVKCE